jgi:hypothetical protein
MDDVKEHLDLYFNETRRMAQQKSEHLIQICLLFIYCLEVIQLK